MGYAIFLVLEPGPRPSWDSTTQRSDISPVESSTRRRPQPFRSFADFDYDPMPYLPSSYSVPGGGSAKKKEGESYKEISRRLDCECIFASILNRNL
ncbi:hypothetical protein NQ314_001686 [Rhamnusium bicolor]|uniref:Uncharacterized protein n=1 Tax=Rhamnusium bicolor TaxID=1586634 RepID=A0AAV8ZUT5_9CUCU|nr:hypothetical protein NQ314_001686 [Rhamnusium bicolor]